MAEKTPDATSGNEQDHASELGDDHPAVQLIRKLRSERNELRGQVKTLSEGSEKVQREADTFIELKARFPFLTKNHLKGREVEEWEAWASELDELRGTPKATADGKTPEDEKKPAVVHPEETDLAKAQKLDGTPANDNPLLNVGAGEALKKVKDGEWTDGDYRQYVEAKRQARLTA